MQKQSKHNLQKFDIIQLPLYMSDFETKPRPVLVENIVNNHIIYRPITDSYHKSQTGEIIHSNHNIKESNLPIKHWKESGLKKPSSINIGVKQSINLKDLPTKIDHYGCLSKIDQQNVPKFDYFVEKYLTSIKDLPDTYYKYVSTHNHANKLANNPYELQNLNANEVDLIELNKPITIDFSRTIPQTEPKVKPQSKSFKDRSRSQDKQNRQKNRLQNRINQYNYKFKPTKPSNDEPSL